MVSLCARMYACMYVVDDVQATNERTNVSPYPTNIRFSFAHSLLRRLTPPPDQPLLETRDAAASDDDEDADDATTLPVTSEHARP